VPLFIALFKVYHRIRLVKPNPEGMINVEPYGRAALHFKANFFLKT